MKDPAFPTGPLKSSSTSNPPSPEKIAQITNCLKTRLSFALMKIQNGWTDQTLEEIESHESGKSASFGHQSMLRGPAKITKGYHRRTNSDSRMLVPRTPVARGSPLRVSTHPSSPKVYGSMTPEQQSEVDAATSLMFLSSPQTQHPQVFSQL
ncbi:hypothetical protein TRVA0_039S00364 [Trichomonascus vanleenenianus]|uniref:Whi5 domain-containing protein n=1 Tax=Trichomonascus vanleenenianus TaxID=2268995 RepID=UPI003EC99345